MEDPEKFYGIILKMPIYNSDSKHQKAIEITVESSVTYAQYARMNSAERLLIDKDLAEKNAEKMMIQLEALERNGLMARARLGSNDRASPAETAPGAPQPPAQSPSPPKQQPLPEGEDGVSRPNGMLCVLHSMIDNKMYCPRCAHSGTTKEVSESQIPGALKYRNPMLMCWPCTQAWNAAKSLPESRAQWDEDMDEIYKDRMNSDKWHWDHLDWSGQR